MRSRVVESSDEDDNEVVKPSSISVTVKTSLVRGATSTPDKPSTSTSVLSKEITAEIYDFGDEEDDGSILLL